MARTKKSERPMEMEARKKARRIETIRKEIVDLQIEKGKLERDLDDWVIRESKRFNVPVPRDPFLLDVLRLVDVETPSRWVWKGGTNNRNLPVLRVRSDTAGSERSVVRYLAEMFGVVDPDWRGILYPLNGADNVNPWYRTKRAFPNGQPSNPDRYNNHNERK